jgi:uncharacterized membrane protein YphA (DoxX/SURF4 family)
MKKITISFLTILRIIVGWHFLYEGIAKLFLQHWSSKEFLLNSQWIFSNVFQTIASSPGTLKIVDFLNIYGLILIGISLIIGLFVRWSSVAGAVLMFLYFVAYPSFPGYNFFSIEEGNYLWVNKTLIELFILVVLTCLPTNLLWGADRLIKNWKEEKAYVPIPSSKGSNKILLNRRELLRNLISVPFLGAFAYGLYKEKQWEAFEKKFIPANMDATTSATILTITNDALRDLKDQVPKGRIREFDLSRLIMGGNLIGGWAHARDLLYVDKLIKAYHSEERVINTLRLAQKCGINAIISNPRQLGIVNKYRHVVKDGDIKFISDCQYGSGFIDGIKLSLDGDADFLYCGGSFSDYLVQIEDFDQLANGLELIRSVGKIAGIGAHRIETVKACVAYGIKPDFWVKTLHHHDYWSAKVDKEQKSTVDTEFKDNLFCFKPQETINFMNQLEEPWIAFKVLAAGAIHPKDAFKYAFESGADYICVGMYDFQIIEDVNITLDALSNIKERRRPWR